MSTYLIGYDLHEGEDYQRLEKAIIGLSETGGYWHHLDSTWLIEHSGPASVIRDALKPFLIRPNDYESAGKRAGDRLLVVELTGEVAWTLSFGSVAGKWLEDHL